MSAQGRSVSPQSLNVNVEQELETAQAEEGFWQREPKGKHPVGELDQFLLQTSVNFYSFKAPKYNALSIL